MRQLRFPVLIAFALMTFGSCQQDQALQNRDNAISTRSVDDDDALEADDPDDEAGFTEIEIEPSTLPAAVTDALQSRYPGALLAEADQLTWTDGSITFDVEFNVDGESIEAMFDINGSFLGEEVDD